MSSAKIASRLDVTTFGNEFACKRNRIGPTIKLLESPEVTGSASMDAPNEVPLETVVKVGIKPSQ